MKRVRPRGGFVVVVVVVCTAIITLGCLGFTAYAARLEDQIEARQAERAAVYAAESGLVLAQRRLEMGSAEPPSGVWFTRELPLSKARFRVEVTRQEQASETLLVTSLGQAVGEHGRRHTVRFEALVRRGDQGTWMVEWRGRT